MNTDFNFLAKYSTLDYFLDAFIMYVYQHSERRSFPSRLYMIAWHKFLFKAVQEFSQLSSLTGNFGSGRSYKTCARLVEIDYTWFYKNFDYVRFGNRKYVPISQQFIRLLGGRNIKVPRLPDEIGDGLLQIAEQVEDFFPKEQQQIAR